MKKTYYFLSILILFIFNINVVNGLETNFTDLYVRGYNNNGNSLTDPSVFNCNELGSCGMEITTLANSYGGAWGIQLPIPIINNHIYSLSLNIRSSNSPVTLSSKYQISIGNSLDNAKNNYISSNFSNELQYYHDAGNNTLQYVFKANINASYIIIPFTTIYNTTASFMIDNIVIEDLGTNSLTENQINNILNNQTSILQSDINNLQENFDNTIKDTFSDCRPSVNLYNPSESYIVGVHNQDIALNYYYNLSVGEKYTFTTPHPWTTINVYDSSNNKLRDYGNIRDSYSQTVTIQEGDSYLILLFNAGNNTNISNYDFTGVQLEKGSKSTPYEPYGQEICKSKLDNLNDTQKETNDKLDDLNDNITNSDSSGASGEAGNFFSNFNTDTFGLTSVITAPLELIKSITSKSCSPLQLTLPFVNKELNLPCLSTIYESYFGSFLTIYRTITFGFVSYWVCIKIFNLVKDFKNPEHDEIEVLDL